MSEGYYYVLYMPRRRIGHYVHKIIVQTLGIQYFQAWTIN